MFFLFFFIKWSLIVTLLICFFFNPNLGIHGGIVSNFVCQLKMAVYGWLSLLAMEPVAQTGLWIWYWVQCDFKGNPCRMFLLICHSHVNSNRTVSASLCSLMRHHVHIFMYCCGWKSREGPSYCRPLQRRIFSKFASNTNRLTTIASGKSKVSANLKQNISSVF